MSATPENGSLDNDLEKKVIPRYVLKAHHFIAALVGLALFLLLTVAFIAMFVYIGKHVDDQTPTLISLIRHIDFNGLKWTFLVTATYLLILDSLIIFTLRSWRKLTGTYVSPEHHGFRAYLGRYRYIHLTFVLLTIFISLSLSAPSQVMNTFTAIVTISVLVTTLFKKVEK